MLLSGELRERIQQVLGELSPRERMFFEMQHFVGMRLQAIGGLGAHQELTTSARIELTTSKTRVAK
jgi:RNA polymerase sigma-70 factor (ECF subfamily)